MQGVLGAERNKARRKINRLETELTSPVSVSEGATPGSIGGILHSLGWVGCLLPFTWESNYTTHDLWSSPVSVISLLKVYVHAQCAPCVYGVCTCVCLYVNMHVCINTCKAYVCIYAGARIYVCMYMYKYWCIHMYTWMYFVKLYIEVCLKNFLCS